MFWIHTLIVLSTLGASSLLSASYVVMSDGYSHDSSSKLGDGMGGGARPLQIGDEVPNFTCESHMGSITLHSYINSGWGVIFT